MVPVKKTFGLSSFYATTDHIHVEMNVFFTLSCVVFSMSTSDSGESGFWLSKPKNVHSMLRRIPIEGKAKRRILGVWKSITIGMNVMDRGSSVICPRSDY